jgi:FtsP/CotA-like multicopper oxidase with cupredoxin domain
MTTRRQFIKIAGLAGATLGVPGMSLVRRVQAQVPGGSLDPTTIPKYTRPLAIPAAMPRTGVVPLSGNDVADYYEIAVRQFEQQILPGGWPATTVWGYGSVGSPASFGYPACTIEAQFRRPVRVRWINDLRHPVTGKYLPHLLPVDPTLHWANPPGGLSGRDGRPVFASTPGRYTGPVPTVPHLHGIERVAQESDGYPEAWFLPDARNIPAGYATTGTFYDRFKTSSSLGSLWTPGSAVFQYPNRQRATTLWYHDHTLGMTRVNVYAGPAGFYLLRGGDDDAVADQLPGPAPARGDRPGTRYYEIPLVIQDRSFNVDGSLFYPDSREFFDGFAGPFIPGSDMAPIWNPEVFANTMVVNGRTWPYLNVERRRYRFRLLNACNSRFLILKHSNGLPFWQIGADGGFLPAPVEQAQLLMAPAERADVIVDFSRFAVGTRIVLLNIGPDEPFGGGVPGADFPVADPGTTGQVLELRVVAATSTDRSTPPQRLRLPDLRGLGRADSSRQVSLNEEESAVLPGIAPLAAKLGTVDAGGMGMPMMWADAPTETPSAGSTEIWEIFNYTEDAHPVHPHTVQVQIINRQPFDPATGLPSGPRRPPEAGETGFKDTIIAYPGEVTRIKARFDSRGLFVWHCHILEHEDNEMMRPLVVSG